MSAGRAAFLISIAALILGLAIAVYDKQLVQKDMRYYRKSWCFRSFGSDYDRPLRVENVIVGVDIWAMGIAGITCTLLVEAGRELDSLKTIFMVGAVFILFSTITIQIVWWEFVGKKK
jgi:hypothetical protein